MTQYIQVDSDIMSMARCTNQSLVSLAYQLDKHELMSEIWSAKIDIAKCIVARKVHSDKINQCRALCSKYVSKYGSHYCTEDIDLTSLGNLDILERALRTTYTKIKKCKALYTYLENVAITSVRMRYSSDPYLVPDANHNFENVVSLIGDNVHRVRELFNLKDSKGNISHRLTTDRLKWVCGWIYGSDCKYLSTPHAEIAFHYLIKVWSSRMFFPFVTETESWNIQCVTGTSWTIRLSTQLPHITRITSKSNVIAAPDLNRSQLSCDVKCAQRTNFGYNLTSSIKIFDALSQLEVLLKEILLSSGVCQLVLDYRGRPSEFDIDVVCLGIRK
jgi:hypothetical protein